VPEMVKLKAARASKIILVSDEFSISANIRSQAD
jgi:hypothetical protein